MVTPVKQSPLVSGLIFPEDDVKILNTKFNTILIALEAILTAQIETKNNHPVYPTDQATLASDLIGMRVYQTVRGFPKLEAPTYITKISFSDGTEVEWDGPDNVEDDPRWFAEADLIRN